MTMKLSLIPIDQDGKVRKFSGALPDEAHEVITSTATLYQTVGFQRPWIGYLAASEGNIVGTCAFKAAPVDGRVEIAYHTFPEHEGKGVSTAMAAELVRIACREHPHVIVAAQTRREHNASTRILEKLGFRCTRSVEHPEDGPVWEWRLMG